MRFFEENKTPDDLKIIFEHTLHSFAYLVKHNESLTFSQFVKRIAQAHSLGSRNLLCIHSMLMFEGIISKFGNQIKLNNVAILHNSENFPRWSGWNKWSESQIQNWIEENIPRLTEIGIFYPSTTMVCA